MTEIPPGPVWVIEPLEAIYSAWACAVPIKMELAEYGVKPWAVRRAFTASMTWEGVSLYDAARAPAEAVAWGTNPNAIATNMAR